MASDRRTNAIRDALDAGDVALGVLENAYSPSLVELYGDLGMDFVWIDLEHGGPSPMDATALEELLRAAEVTDTELLVRLPASEPALVRKALDAGVRNVFVSQVENAEDVRRIVEAGQFRYAEAAGRRGLANPRSRRWGLAEDYVASEDAEVVIGAMIENRAALESLDDILAVPELGFVFAGPGDFSVSLGHPGESDHPDVREAVETVRERAAEADVALAGLADGIEDAHRKAEEGYQLLTVGSTTGVLRGQVREWLDEDGDWRSG